jgi:hypothetical protein
MGSFVRRSGIMAAVAIAGAAFTAAAPAAQAQAVVGGLGTISVPCSTAALVTAITAANSGGGATLTLAGNCTYTITTPAVAGDGLPVITGHITLQGGTHTVISRNSLTAFRILDVASGGMLRLINLAVRNGSTAGLGGGIQNAGTLMLNQVMLVGNTAGNGGGLANAAGATASLYQAVMAGNTTTGVGGGGIINYGVLTMFFSTLSGNTAPINGGGLNTQTSGISRIVQSVFVRNVSGGLGGGMSNLGTTSIYDTLVQRNTGSSGGGIAISNNNVTLRGSTVSNNIPNNCNPLNTIPGCVN